MKAQCPKCTHEFEIRIRKLAQKDLPLLIRKSVKLCVCPNCCEKFELPLS
jgi:hypothetical protein